MRASGLVLLTVATASAPAFAAKSTFCDRHPSACAPASVTTLNQGMSGIQNANVQSKRALQELILRAMTNDDSGALDISKFTHWASALIPPNRMVTGSGPSSNSQPPSAQPMRRQQRREFLELLARAVAEEQESGALDIAGAAKTAFQWAKTHLPPIISGIHDALNGPSGGYQQPPMDQQAPVAGQEPAAQEPPVDEQLPVDQPPAAAQPMRRHQRRELVELLARAIAEDTESGAFDIGGAAKSALHWAEAHIPPVITGIHHALNGLTEPSYGMPSTAGAPSYYPDDPSAMPSDSVPSYPPAPMAASDPATPASSGIPSATSSAGVASPSNTDAAYPGTYDGTYAPSYQQVRRFAELRARHSLDARNVNDLD